MRMTQCRFRQNTESGYIEYVSWIPTNFAILNKFVKFKNFSGNWKVHEVFETVDSKELMDQHDAKSIWEPSAKYKTGHK